jgi:hypothetical protein
MHPVAIAQAEHVLHRQSREIGHRRQRRAHQRPRHGLTQRITHTLSMYSETGRPWGGAANVMAGIQDPAVSEKLLTRVGHGTSDANEVNGLYLKDAEHRTVGFDTSLSLFG